MTARDVLRIHLGHDSVSVKLSDESALSPLETLVREPGWAEQRPDDWWDALTAAISDLRARADLSAVTTIELTRDLRGWVLLDGDREPIRPAILDGDVRIEGSPLPWLRQHEPIAYKRIQHILTPKAWLRCQLTGEIVADAEHAADIGLVDVATRRWSEQRCDDLEINIDLLPVIVPPDSRMPVQSGVARDFHLSPDCVVLIY